MSDTWELGSNSVTVKPIFHELNVNRICGLTLGICRLYIAESVKIEKKIKHLI